MESAAMGYCSRRNQPSNRSAFTLIELLVVVAIIALLISILLPSLQRARDQAKNAVCGSNMHQLGLTLTQYMDEFKGRMPYHPGSGPQQNQAPFRQYHQLFNFWNYHKDLKIYVCPSARDENSVKVYTDFSGSNPYASYYVVRSSDSRYLQAYQQNWWPEINPSDFTSAGDDFIDPLYTEYWFNDWSVGATLNGQPVPAINGGVLEKIPFPNLAVVMADAVWETKSPRHNAGAQLLFVDGHVQNYRRERYLDPLSTRNGNIPKDYDGYGNRPFYTWGLTRTGIDGDLP